jgi:hypothetical protein
VSHRVRRSCNRTAGVLVLVGGVAVAVSGRDAAFRADRPGAVERLQRNVRHVAVGRGMQCRDASAVSVNVLDDVHLSCVRPVRTQSPECRPQRTPLAENSSSSAGHVIEVEHYQIVAVHFHL